MTDSAGFTFIDTETDESEVDPFPLAALNGATLSWDDADGNRQSVTFDE